jgi:hypothetical protein
MRGRVCNLQCNRRLVSLLTTNNHTLPSHLRLCSFFVASYDSQGLRWRYSNPPPHRVTNLCMIVVQYTRLPIQIPSIVTTRLVTILLPTKYSMSQKSQWGLSPSRSPGLTPLDFYFWGYVKEVMYSDRIHNNQHLKQRVREAAAL